MLVGIDCFDLKAMELFYSEVYVHAMEQVNIEKQFGGTWWPLKQRFAPSLHVHFINYKVLAG